MRLVKLQVTDDAFADIAGHGGLMFLKLCTLIDINGTLTMSAS